MQVRNLLMETERKERSSSEKRMEKNIVENKEQKVKFPGKNE